MAVLSSTPRLPIPQNWRDSVRLALLHVIALGHYAITCIRGCAATGDDDRARHVADIDQRDQEIALLREELRIKDARWQRISPAKCPHYQPTERLAILELRAARAWTVAQTAQAFHVTEATIRSWDQRLDEQGPAALLQTPEPVN